jgi:hypothetical protein
MVESNGTKILATLWAMAAVVALFIGGRFYCKAATTRRFGIDDGLLLLAWVSWKPRTVSR